MISCISTYSVYKQQFQLVKALRGLSDMFHWPNESESQYNIHNLTIEQSATPTSRRASSFAWHGLQDYNQSAPDPSSNPPASDLVECWLSQSCKLPHLPPNATLSVQLTNACGSLKAASSLKLYKEWHTETRQVVMAMASTFHPMKNTNLPHADLPVQGHACHEKNMQTEIIHPISNQENRENHGNWEHPTTSSIGHSQLRHSFFTNRNLTGMPETAVGESDWSMLHGDFKIFVYLM